jgi:DNA-binding PadR family transcriptional regulator
LLQGTLDVLILRTLVLGPRHGQGIARSIQQQSEDVFLVDHGSLYLALQRLEARGWVKADTSRCYGLKTPRTRLRNGVFKPH